MLRDADLVYSSGGTSKQTTLRNGYVVCKVKKTELDLIIASVLAKTNNLHTQNDKTPLKNKSIRLNHSAERVSNSS